MPKTEGSKTTKAGLTHIQTREKQLVCQYVYQQCCILSTLSTLRGGSMLHYLNVQILCPFHGKLSKG